MLSNVKTQIEGIGGWLGSSIPKLRKGDAETDMEHQPLGDEGGTPASAESVKGSPQQKDDDDNSRFVGTIRISYRSDVGSCLVLLEELILDPSLLQILQLTKKMVSLEMVRFCGHLIS